MAPNLLNEQVKEEAVKVVVRCRPLSQKEIKVRSEKIVTLYAEKGVVEVKHPRQSGVLKRFAFDTAYDECATQSELYDETVRPLVDSVLMGFNCTIFAYGQTGAGKTFTMEGDFSGTEKKGIIPNVFEHIFHHINNSENKQYLVQASYLEIYQEEIRDLLTNPPKVCELRQKPGEGVHVKDLSVYLCKNKEEIDNVLKAGKKNRSVGATDMNAHSSRSHAVFIITVEHSEVGEGKERLVKVGTLNLVDLAGSERQSKTGAVGNRQKESIKINLSLSALSNVISALVDGKKTHIPYRDSKLTRLLQDSLGGNSKTLMIANIGPSESNFDETLTTLRYANRAKNIKNVPVVNQDPKDAMLRKFQEEIARLKAELAKKKELQEKQIKKKMKAKKPLGDESENEETDGENEEEVIKKKEELLQAERTAILNDHNLIAADRDRLLHELEIKQNELQKEREAIEELKHKIESMECKLLRGGKNIIDHTNEQQRELEQRKQLLLEQKAKEREMLRKLEEQEGNVLEIKETYSTLRQEVDIKTKKLKKLILRLQALKRDIQEEQEINSRERQEQEEVQDMLLKNLKLTCLVIDNFVQPDQKAKILKTVQFNEDEHVWTFLPPSQVFELASRPVSADQKSKRPMCMHAKTMWKNTHNPRYASENVVVTDLDLSVRTTNDYNPPVVDPYAREVMDNILEPEAGLEIDASDLKYLSSHSKKSAKKRTRVKTAKSKKDGDEEATYPVARGLVPRN